MKPAYSIVPGLALAALLSACGGGVSFGDFHDDGDELRNVPYESNMPGEMTVARAVDVSLNATYRSSGVLLNNVWRFFATGSHPETCRFRFGGLQHPTRNQVLSGEIWYLPKGSAVELATVSINGQEFDVQDTRAVTADPANNRVVFQDAQARSTQSVETITLNGTIPIRPGTRDPGC